MANHPGSPLSPEAFTARLHASEGPITDWPFADVPDLSAGEFIRSIHMYTPTGKNHVIVGSVNEVQDNRVHLRQQPTPSDGLAHEELTVTLNSADDAKAWEQMYGVRLLIAAKPTAEADRRYQRRGIVPLGLLGIEQPIEPSVNGHAMYRTRSAGRNEGFVQGIVALVPEAANRCQQEMRVGIGSPALRGTVVCRDVMLRHADGLPQYRSPQVGDHIRTRVKRFGPDASVFCVQEKTPIFVGKHGSNVGATA